MPVVAGPAGTCIKYKATPSSNAVCATTICYIQSSPLELLNRSCPNKDTHTTAITCENTGTQCLCMSVCLVAEVCLGTTTVSLKDINSSANALSHMVGQSHQTIDTSHYLPNSLTSTTSAHTNLVLCLVCAANPHVHTLTTASLSIL